MCFGYPSTSKSLISVFVNVFGLHSVGFYIDLLVSAYIDFKDTPEVSLLAIKENLDEMEQKVRNQIKLKYRMKNKK